MKMRKRKGKKEGKGREISLICKFATPGKISSLQLTNSAKNPCFYSLYTKSFSFWGTSSPNPLLGLCPWTPLGDFPPP